MKQLVKKQNLVYLISLYCIQPHQKNNKNIIPLKKQLCKCNHKCKMTTILKPRGIKYS